MTYIRRNKKTYTLCIPNDQNVSWEDVRGVCKTLDIDPKAFGVPEDLLECAPPVTLH